MDMNLKELITFQEGEEVKEILPLITSANNITGQSEGTEFILVLTSKRLIKLEQGEE